MKIIAVVLTMTILMLVAGCLPTESITDVPGLSSVIDGEYIVVYKKDPLAGARAGRAYTTVQQSAHQFTNQFLSRFAIRPTAVMQVYSHALHGFAARLTPGQAEQLRHDPLVSYIVPNQFGVSEPIQGEITPKGARAAAGQETPWGISYVGGFVDCSTWTQVVYILDTGIDLTHPDLKIDTTRGYNVFKTGNDAKTLDDLNGHGTVVAGIIGAVNNSIGVVGVAAGITLVPVKVNGSDNKSTAANTIAGLDFVTANAHPGDVVNLSLGFAGNAAADDAVLRLMNRGDVYASAAAGNIEQGNRDANKISPARVNTTNFYTISAHDKQGNFCTSFSCAGNPPIDFAAPGNQIKSTYYNGGYINVYGGTTLSAAHGSGILMATQGIIYAKGTVKNDPDGTPDFKASRVP